MGSFIVRRLLWSIPTIFILMSLIFLMANSTPRDAIDIKLAHQGITLLSTPDYKEIYEKTYSESHLNLPQYYFSMAPSYFPDNINTIVDPIRRNRAIKLLDWGYDLTTGETYNSLIEQLKADQNLSSFSINNLSPEELANSDFASGLSPSQIRELAKIQSHKIEYYLPSFRWHGLSNQFHYWFKGVLRGDWGYSFTDGSPIKDKVSRALSWTLTLFFINLSLLLIIGCPIVFLAVYKENIWSKVVEYFSLIFYIMPIFWLATLVQVFLTTPEYGMQIFPAYQEDYTSDQGFGHQIGSFLTRYLPAVICLLLTDLAVFVRYLKSNIIKERFRPYVNTAVSKGIPRYKVLLRHIIPNVMNPIVTIIIGSLPLFISGSLIIEVIFNIPGMGRLMFNSIVVADWSVLYFITLLIGILTTIVYLVGDLIYPYFDPKIKYE